MHVWLCVGLLCPFDAFKNAIAVAADPICIVPPLDELLVVETVPRVYASVFMLVGMFILLGGGMIIAASIYLCRKKYELDAYYTSLQDEADGLQLQ